MSKLINFGLITIFLFGLQACSGNKYLSQTANEEFRIDGERVEWAGRFEIPKKEDFGIGVSHTQNYLYVAISSLDRKFERQLAMRGLTIWVDAKGKKHEDLGLMFQSIMPMDRRPGSPGNRPSRQSPSEDLMRNASPFKGDLDLIVIDKKGRERLGPADLLATARSGDGGLFMEYQIPLALLGEDYEAGQILGVGISSEFDKSNMPAGGRGGMSGGGMSGGGMSGGGRGGSGSGKMGGGGGGRPGMQDRPDQTDLNVWLKVEFAQK